MEVSKPTLSFDAVSAKVKEGAVCPSTKHTLAGRMQQTNTNILEKAAVHQHFVKHYEYNYSHGAPANVARVCLQFESL